MTDINKLEELAKAASQDWTIGRGVVRINLHKYSGVELYGHTKENTDYLYAVRPSEIQALISKYRRMEEALRAAKALVDNINEFGAVTDAEFLDCAEMSVRQALQDQDQ